MKKAWAWFTVGGVALAVAIACGKQTALAEGEETEAGQSASEEMSSLDESLSGINRDQREMIDAVEAFEAAESRAECTTVSFSSCSSMAKTRTFGGCTRGGATWDGTVTLTFSQALCTMAAVNDTVTRTGDVTVTGRRGASIQVTSANKTTFDSTVVGGGQKLTRTAVDAFKLDVLGVNRIATTGATELFNISRKTTDPILITGNARQGRVVNGGKLKAWHNKAQFTVEWVSSNVTWASTCKCPISGSQTGTFAGSQSGTLSITYTGCGTATVTKGDATAAITLDSCEKL